MKRNLRRILIVLLASACLIYVRQRTASVSSGEDNPVAADSAPSLEIDLTPRPLRRIPVGTVIGTTPPEGWSHLVLFAIPTLTPEDARDAPKLATYYAQLFKLTVLANVLAGDSAKKPGFYLAKVGRGFATTVAGQEKIVSGQDTLGANVGVFGQAILKENEKILDEDVRQVVRTPTMLIFDAKSVVLAENEHVSRITRHALLVDPAGGQLYTLVWLLTDDYEAAGSAMQLLPAAMHEARLLSVDRSKFTFGIPSREAFALRRIPQGTPVSYTPELKRAATTSTFTAGQVPAIEETLRRAAKDAEDSSRRTARTFGKL